MKKLSMFRLWKKNQSFLLAQYQKMVNYVKLCTTFSWCTRNKYYQSAWSPRGKRLDDGVRVFVHETEIALSLSEYIKKPCFDELLLVALAVRFVWDPVDWCFIFGDLQEKLHKMGCTMCIKVFKWNGMFSHTHQAGRFARIFYSTEIVKNHLGIWHVQIAHSINILATEIIINNNAILTYPIDLIASTCAAVTRVLFVCNYCETETCSIEHPSNRPYGSFIGSIVIVINIDYIIYHWANVNAFPIASLYRFEIFNSLRVFIVKINPLVQEKQDGAAKGSKREQMRARKSKKEQERESRGWGKTRRREEKQKKRRRKRREDQKREQLREVKGWMFILWVSMS